jgi:hypothetical protein
MDRFSHVALAAGLLRVAEERSEHAYLSTLPMIAGKPSYLHRVPRGSRIRRVRSEHPLWAEFQAAQGLLNVTHAVADEETLRTRFSIGQG